MSNAATGLMSEISPDPARFSYAYVNGQFIVQAVETNFTGEIFSFIGVPDLANSITAVDAGIGGATESNKYVIAGCRAGSNNDGYLVLFDPTAGLASLWRNDPDDQVKLVETDVSHLVAPGVNQFHRIEIDCYLDLISASVNGEVVLAEFDSTYTTGANYIGIGNYSVLPDDLFGVFDNLTVTDQGAPLTATAPAPPDVSGDLNATFTSLKNAALLQPSAAGPTQSTIIQDINAFNFIRSNVSLTDFYATVTFINPSDTSRPWDVGMALRYVDQQSEIRFILESTGSWYATIGTDQPFASGTVPSISSSPNESNTIKIIAQGTMGIVAVNSVVLPALNLPQPAAAGDVAISSGFYSDNLVHLRPVPFQNFQVWNLSAASTSTGSPFTMTPTTIIAGPASGSLLERADTVQTTISGVNVSDFFTTVVFVVPADVSVPWDFTIGFRDAGGVDHYRLTITSGGQWRIALGTNAPAASGTVANLATSPGQENTIDLLVQSSAGAVALNGTDFAVLDLSSGSTSGDVWIATGNSSSNTLPGRTTQFSDFEVWSLA